MPISLCPYIHISLYGSGFCLRSTPSLHRHFPFISRYPYIPIFQYPYILISLFHCINISLYPYIRITLLSRYESFLGSGVNANTCATGISQSVFGNFLKWMVSTLVIPGCGPMWKHPNGKTPVHDPPGERYKMWRSSLHPELFIYY